MRHDWKKQGNPWSWKLPWLNTMLQRYVPIFLTMLSWIAHEVASLKDCTLSQLYFQIKMKSISSQSKEDLILPTSCLLLHKYISLRSHTPPTVEGDQKAPFSYSSLPEDKRGWQSFPWIDPLTLDPSFYLMSVMQRGIKYHFSSLWYDDLAGGWTHNLVIHSRMLYLYLATVALLHKIGNQNNILRERNKVFLFYLKGTNFCGSQFWDFFAGT